MILAGPSFSSCLFLLASQSACLFISSFICSFLQPICIPSGLLWGMREGGSELRLRTMATIPPSELFNPYFGKSFSSFFFPFFMPPHAWHMEVPRLAVEREQWLLVCTTAPGNSGSLTHCPRPGIEPVSSWLLGRFVFH